MKLKIVTTLIFLLSFTTVSAETKRCIDEIGACTGDNYYELKTLELLKLDLKPVKPSVLDKCGNENSEVVELKGYRYENAAIAYNRRTGTIFSVRLTRKIDNPKKDVLQELQTLYPFLEKPKFYKDEITMDNERRKMNENLPNHDVVEIFTNDGDDYYSIDFLNQEIARKVQPCEH